VAYIGRPSIVGNFVKLDAISVVNGQAAYTMQNSSANFTDYSTVNQFMVSLNGTIQSPGSSFTVSGSTLTFASNLSTGDVIDFIIVFGNSLSAGVPTDDTVTAAKLNDDIISGQTALASEPADTDEFLVSDAGTLKRIDYSLIKGGGITMADQWRVTANITANADPISSNLERIDTAGQGTIGTAMSVSSGVFTFPSTGIYLVQFNAFGNTASGGDNVGINLKVTTNNSSYAVVATAYDGNQGGRSMNLIGQSLIDVTDTSNVKVSFQALSIDSGSYLFGDTTGTSQNETYFTFIRLGDT